MDILRRHPLIEGLGSIKVEMSVTPAFSHAANHNFNR
jgi:hypothetical protein